MKGGDEVAGVAEVAGWNQRFSCGDELPEVIKEEITHTQLVKYAGASGDFNPVHTVTQEGEKAGFGGVIAHGMLIMGYAGQAIGMWFPRKNLRRFKVRFAAVTRPGEQITLNGRVLEEITVGDEKRLLCAVTASNSQGEIKLKGEFEIGGEE